MASEFEFIDQLRRRCPVRPPVMKGIGDDAAVLQHATATSEVVTTDLLMEGVDFLLESASPELIGRKSLAVNLSDIAAMGARPTAAFVAVSLSRQWGQTFADRFYDGLLQLADQFQVTIAGGDTNSWDGPFVCCVTAMGVPCGTKPVLRSGAKPGDILFVTGACGGSLSGRHLDFVPRLQEAARLVELVDVHAMIDISDGLAADLHHLLSESGVGAELQEAAIPIHPDVHEMPSGKTPLERALSDGEDFELIFAVAEQDAIRLLAEWDLETPLHELGRITAAPGCWLTTPHGQRYELPPLGWTHDLQREYYDS